MAKMEFTIETLEAKIRDCQKRIIINRELLKEDGNEGDQRLIDEINKLKKLILFFQRELSQKYKEKFPGTVTLRDSLEYTEMYF